MSIKYVVVRLAGEQYVVARTSPDSGIFFELCRAAGQSQAQDIARVMNERAAARLAPEGEAA